MRSGAGLCCWWVWFGHIGLWSVGHFGASSQVVVNTFTAVLIQYNAISFMLNFYLFLPSLLQL